MFNILNWYWVVAESNSVVFATASLSYVPVTDTAYVAWLAAGNLPTRMDTPYNLAAVIQPAVTVILAGGVTLTSTATPALDGAYAIDAEAQQTIVALSTGIAAGKPLPGGGATFNFRDSSGTRHAFTAGNFLDFAAVVEDYVYHLGEALIDRVSGIDTAFPDTALTIP